MNDKCECFAPFEHLTDEHEYDCRGVREDWGMRCQVCVGCQSEIEERRSVEAAAALPTVEELLEQVIEPEPKVELPTGTNNATVLRWFINKSFGFVKPDGSTEDLFVHFKEVSRENNPYRILIPGMRVSFEYGVQDGKLRGNNIRILDEQPPGIDTKFVLACRQAEVDRQQRRAEQTAK